MTTRRTRHVLNLVSSGWLLTVLGGGLVLAQDAGGTLKPKQLAVLEGSMRSVTSIATARNGRIVVSGHVDGAVRIWDADAGRLQATLRGHSDDDAVRSLSVTPDGQTLASASRDGTVRLWSIATGAQLRIIEQSTQGHRAVAFSADGRTLAIYEAGSAQLWDVATGEKRSTMVGKLIGSKFTADGEVLNFGRFSPQGGAGTMFLWNPATGRQDVIASYTNRRIVSDAITPDGKTIATGPIDWKDATLELWDVAAGTVRFRLPGHSDAVTDVEFSPDGKTLASAGGAVRLWDVATGKLLATLTGPKTFNRVTFSSDGKTLVAGAGEGPFDRHKGRITLWELGGPQ